MILSVLITTYNQESYVEETLKSVFSQKTNFDYEVIICDDCSIDKTVDVIDSFVVSYSNVTVVENGCNIGPLLNYTQCLKLAKGKYIADIGGDDIWVDELKLQKQVDFLEHNPEYGMVHTQYSRLIDRTGKLQKNCAIPLNGSDCFKSLLTFNPICAVSVCTKLSLVLPLIPYFESGELTYEDLPMNLEVAYKSKIGYIDNSMTYYRVIQGSVSRKKDLVELIDYNKQHRKIVDFFVKRFSISNAPYAALEQQESINLCCAYFVHDDLNNFLKYYKKLNKIPRRVFVMRVLLQVFSGIKIPNNIKYLVYKE